jgi:hypothetical protein
MRPRRIDPLEDIFDRICRTKSSIMLLKFASLPESVVYYQADIHTPSRRSKVEGVQPPDSISKYI